MSYGSRNGVYDQGGLDFPSSPAYNVEPVTSTSSSSCVNNGRRTPRWVLDDRRSPPSVAALFSHFATRMVDNTVDLYAAKPDIRPESHFLFIPPAFDAPVRGGSRRNIATPFGTEKLECGATWWWKNFEDIFICFDMIHERNRQTDGQTDRHRMTA